MRVWIHAQHGTRMGNWMFQYAVARSLSDDVGCFVEEGALAAEMKLCPWLADLPFTETYPEGATTWAEKNLFVYEPIRVPECGDLVLDGLYQNSRYFDREKVLAIFSPSESDVVRLRDEYKEAFVHADLTSIGVRRGDYLHCPHEFPFVGTRYYEDALARLPEVRHFLVCSDDIPWCKTFFTSERFPGRTFYFSHARSAKDDIALPSLCANNILANSTFSWWGGYLNRNPDKRTIAASRWLGSAIRRTGVDWSDVYYEGTEIVNNDSGRFRLAGERVLWLWANVIKKKVLSPPYQWTKARCTAFFRSTFMLCVRAAVARVRGRIDPLYRRKQRRVLREEIEANRAYEAESCDVWRPKVLDLAETLRKVIEHRVSLARFGDGEFELMAGRNMSFELANVEMAARLKAVLANPQPNCLVCVPNVFGSLVCYRASEAALWRKAALWMRPILKDCAAEQTFGDTEVSRPYLGVGQGERADEIFELWKKLFANRDIIIVEGRFSRLGIGNDLFAGARRIRRIWCPANGAYAKYAQIKSAILSHASRGTLIVMALGATATLLAYDLAQDGYWAVDAGHVDVEYMWMKMGATEKCPIPGRYVNECIATGREMVKVRGEAEANNVIAEIV